MNQPNRHISTLTPLLAAAAGRVRAFAHLLPRQAVRFTLDIAILALAYCLSFLIRYEGQPTPAMVRVWWVTLPFVVALQYSVLAWMRVPRFCWSLISLEDMPPILYGLMVSAVWLLLVRIAGELLVNQFPLVSAVMIPASVIVIDTVLAIGGVAGIRGLRRLRRQRGRRRTNYPIGTHDKAILIGAGQGGRMLAEELHDRLALGITPVAFVDDDRRLSGRMVAGIPVAGTTADLPTIARQHNASMALIAIASADPGSMHRIVKQCETAGLRTKIIPQLTEIVSGKCRISQIRDVAIEDLLGRAPVNITASEAHVAVTGKVALVTGAGGSIGSELCRQITRLSPRVLVLVERTENSLYQIHRELLPLAKGMRIVPELADIRDIDRIDHVFQEHRPHVVFHAAAHKHVPMMESQPGEAIRNNVFGTKVVADVADRYRAERFVLISTDKAVHPTSVMGATKRLAELYLQEMNACSDVRYVSVRFGNVLGSAGSVIPLFQEQIAKGGPLTITHPDMERYFMTIPEASRLVLEAAGLCQGGEVMILDMGSPIKIRTLAEQMIRLSGFEPEVDIQIKYTGIRPGEKLFEELSHRHEMVLPTKCPKIFVLRAEPSAVPMAAILDTLASAGRSPEAVKVMLRQVLPEYTCLPTAS